MNNTRTILGIWLMSLLAVSFVTVGWTVDSYGVETGPRETIRMRVVAVNPSDSKTRKVPIKVYLPQECNPRDIVNRSGLDVEYDSEKSQYYAFNKGVELAPKQTRVFEIEVRDVWFIPQETIDGFRKQTSFVVNKLQKSDFYEDAKKLADAIHHSLDTIVLTQNDETISRKRHIGVFRNNLLILEHIRKDVDSLQRILTIASAPPIPEVLEQKQIKSESPSKRTTWIIIFIIMVFISMLAAVFFFTWHAQSRYTKERLMEAKKSAFPESREPKAPEGDRMEK